MTRLFYVYSLIGFLAVISILSGITLGFTTDNFFVNLLENKGDISSGYAVFEIKNPFSVDIPFNSKVLDIEMYNVTDSKINIFYNTTIPVNLINVTESCIPETETLLNGSIMNKGLNCTRIVINTTSFQEVFEPIINLNKLKAKTTYKFKIEGTWKAKLGARHIEWIPVLNISGIIYRHTKWASWFTDWNISQQIQLDAPTTYANFTTFVSMNTSTFFKNNCGDFRPLENNNVTAYTWEVENGTCGETNTTFWVRFNTTAGTNITNYMFYNNSDAANLDAPKTAWDGNYNTILHFGDVNGATRARDSLNNEHFTINAGCGINGTNQSGRYGHAVIINKSNCLPISDGSISLSEQTIEAWIYLQDTRATQNIWHRGSATNIVSAISGYWNLSANVFSCRKEEAAVNAVGVTTLQQNTWYYVACVYDATTGKLQAWVNGVNEGNATVGNLGTVTGDFRIGCDGFGGTAQCFKGHIDEFRISNKRREAEYFRMQYNRTRMIYGAIETSVPPPSPTDTCTPPSNTNWTIEASDNCVISGQSVNVTDIFIQGASGYVIFQHSNITSRSCRIQPNTGASIMLAIYSFVNWGNAC